LEHTDREPTRTVPLWVPGVLVALVVLLGAAAVKLLATRPPNADTTSLVGLVVGGIGLVVALAAAREAKRAADSAETSLSLATEGLAMARAEHAAFLAQLQARAKLEISLRIPNADPDGRIVADEERIRVDLVLGLRNVGDKAAHDTLVTFLVPQGHPGLQWRTEAAHPEPTPERLNPVGDEATGPEAQWISRLISRVGRRTVWEVWANFTVRVPVGGEVIIPTRCKAESDDVAEDEPESVLNTAVRIVRGAP
jgi:hypothetical protein